MAHRDWIIIGVSGVTCGGKTTLASNLKDSFSNSYLFHQDKYFYPDDSAKHVKVEGVAHNNYDILSSLDMEGMYEDVMATLNGDVKAHSVNEKGSIDVGKKVLILEGFTLLNYKPLYDLCDLRYYLVLERDECVRRRSGRTYDPPDVPGYFDLCVWPEHERYRRELEGSDAVFVDGRRGGGLVCQEVVAAVRAVAER